LRRPGMSPKRLAEVRTRQMPDAEKRRRAGFVVQTGLDKRASRTALLKIVRKLKHR
jgi:dephospho-CoA kinase